MTATTNGQTKKTTVVDSLRKADERWARRHSDQPAPSEYLEHLACSLPAAAVASNSDAAPSITDTEVARLREQVVAAENNAATRRGELDQARALIDELREQAQAAEGTAEQRVNDLRTELGRHVDAQESRAKRAEAERDKFREQLTQTRAEIKELGKQSETQQRDAAENYGVLEATRLERDQLAEQLAEARAQKSADDGDKVREQAKLIGELRADYDAAAADTQKLADELEAMRADRDALIARVVAADQHECAWLWHGAGEPIKPCSCGRPVPRYELREVG